MDLAAQAVVHVAHLTAAHLAVAQAVDQPAELADHATHVLLLATFAVQHLLAHLVAQLTPLAASQVNVNHAHLSAQLDVERVAHKAWMARR